MNIPKVEDIDAAGYRLLALLDIKQQAKVVHQQPEPKILFGIGAAVDLSEYLVESKGTTEHTTDSWDTIVAISRSKDGKIMELSKANYPLLKAVAALFLGKEEYALVADSKFVEEEIFEWLVDAAEQQRVGLTLTAFLERRLYEETRPYTYYFKIRPIGIESTIHFGGVEILPFTEEFLRSVYDKLPEDNHGTWENYKLIFSDLIDSVVVAVEVKAVNSMAETVAETKASQAVNALKCFLFPQAISSQFYLFDLEFKATPPEMTMVVMKYSEEGDMRINKKSRGGAPIELTTEQLIEFERMGLGLFDDFLTSSHFSSFHYLVTRAIEQLGNTFSTRDLYARAVELVSFFELFLNYDHKAGAKPQTYLTRDILPHLLPAAKIEAGKKQIQLLYIIRNRYLHNRERLPFEIRELLEVHIMAFRFLKLMVSLDKQFSTKEDFFRHFAIPC